MLELLQPWMMVIYAALGIAVLVVLAAVAMRLFSGSVRGRKGSRLGISEYYEIDKSRRLVLIRRDDVEHLVLIGGNQDVVIEDGIGSPLMAPQAQQAPRQSPRPPVFGSRRPPLRSVDSMQSQEFENS